jgi:hypothetical protein
MHTAQHAPNAHSDAILPAENRFPKHHPGQFKKGEDSRRAGGGMRLYDGYTLSELARKRTPECINLLVRAMQGEDVPWPVRVRATEILLDRGHGRAVSLVEMNVTHNRDITSLTRDELRAIAAGHVPSTPITCTVEGEAFEVAGMDSGTAVHTASDSNGEELP